MRTLAALTGLAILNGAAAQGYAQGTTAAERLQLPKYCWPQYIDKKYSGQPGHSIPAVCGQGMNHLCPGLLHLIRAQKASDPPRVRGENASRALGELGYTQRAMTKECPLRPEVDAAIARARTIQAIAK